MTEPNKKSTKRPADWDDLAIMQRANAAASAIKTAETPEQRAYWTQKWERLAAKVRSLQARVEMP